MSCDLLNTSLPDIVKEINTEETLDSIPPKEVVEMKGDPQAEPHSLVMETDQETQPAFQEQPMEETNSDFDSEPKTQNENLFSVPPNPSQKKNQTDKIMEVLRCLTFPLINQSLKKIYKMLDFWVDSTLLN